MGELLRFREHALNLMNVKDIKLVKDYKEKFEPLQQCMMENMDLVMKHFDSHVKAIFGDGIDTYGFLFEYFARAENNNFLSNFAKTAVIDLSKYIGDSTSALLEKTLKDITMSSGFVNAGIKSRIALINARENSITKTPVSKGLLGLFKSKKITFIDDILSTVVVGDNDIAANYMALNMLAHMVPGVDMTELNGLEHISINVAKLSAYCAGKNTIESIRKRMYDNIESKIKMIN